MDADFASNRGFKDRVAHGALLCAFISRLVGIYLPGENCLLQTINVKFLLPTYVNDNVEVMGIVEQVSLGARIFTLSITITNLSSGSIVARGKVSVGFTSAFDDAI
jgi:3-hydroxybutyryl-CoA dehydratase